ncbi:MULTISPECIES: hypothetical protein [unclassified Aureispira]|uniref:hypothetical protein n=1 Tax=unclassified Aureispira TaxID=2649989 RepID=UPI0006984539|nr:MULTISPECIES: hypothetical protein [unclassified Aureispira]WMX12601.1 peptidoglycan-binding protein [Aureispira sp. CCB-E]
MKYLIVFSLLISTISCNLIFEEDLSKRKVDMLSPPNGYTTYTQTQTFVWDSLPDVSTYRFQIVSQRFDFIEDYVLDTVISGRRLTLGLEPKEYQWRVIGRNNSSETDYNTYSLSVVQDTTLANQTVNLIAPTPSTIYAKDSVAFFWTALGLANQYQLQVATHPSFNSQTIAVDTATTQDYVYLIRRLGLGTFYYRIRAMRVGRDTTSYTSVKQFNINMIPIHNTPANNSTLTLPFNMSWQRASRIAKDSLFLYHNNTATPYQKLELTNNNYTFNSSDTVGYGAGTYYWQVKSVGTNNQQSSRSSLWQFTIN